MVEKQHKAKCPICSEPADAHYRPFCSRRCADIDLHRWLSGRYAIPGRDDDEPDSGAEVPRRAAAEESDDDAGDDAVDNAHDSPGDNRKSKKD